MPDLFIGLIIGFFVGGTIGFIICGLLSANKNIEEDEKLNR